MTEWIRAEELLDRLPAPRRSTAPLLRAEFLGKKEVPPEIPLQQAVAVAAFAQAHARGVSKARRVYDEVAAAAWPFNGQLVVIRRGSAVELAGVDGFSPTAAVVIDLQELIDAVRSGAEIQA